MFRAGATFLDRAREFHRDRVTKMHSGDTPHLLSGEGGRLVLHIIPFSAFGSETSLDPRNISGQYLPPLWSMGFNPGYNADGYLTTSGANSSRGSYVQVFRNGILEAAAGDVRSKGEPGWVLFTQE